MGKLFTKAAYPLLLPAHSSGTTAVVNNKRIVDASGNAWSLSADRRVMVNGAAAGYSSQVVILLYYNGTIYQSNAAGNWWSWSGSTWVSVSGDPRTTPLLPFWGINGHDTWSQPAYTSSNWGNNAAAIRDLGTMAYRNGYSANYDSSTGAITSSDGNTTLSFMNAYPDITMVPVLLPRWKVAYDNVTTGTETTAYTMGYNLGVDAATKLGGRVPYFGCGNEFENGYVSNSGNSKTDYDNAAFLRARGSIRGMIAGIKSVNPAYKICAPAISWVHFGFLDMLADGSTPSAPTTYDSTKIVTWDITDLHVYTQNSTSSDNFEALVGQPISNGITRACGYGKPIVISEYGVNTYKQVNSVWTALYPDEASISAALTTQGYLLDKWYAIRNSYSQPILSCMLYQLADAASDGSNTNETNFGLLGTDSTTKKGRYTAVKNFIAAHPV
ncbi:hypothetical protein [Caballeronia sp. AZ10_KS36]|uniref:hypothetical protein n=1 Tax=Caballeronia sp. AZ10_KS36 TaxID=2921757 RepID=UPI00202915DF|nr:hypothetical protein [Caballeronia sp. AZ10_KS36]